MPKRTITWSLVPFSGGIDSFYATVRELEEGHGVLLSYFQLQNNDTKSKAELQYRAWLVKILRDHYGKEWVIDEGKLIDLELHGTTWPKKFALVQACLWTFFSNSNYEFDRLVMPYISGDGAISWKKELNALDQAIKDLGEEYSYETVWPSEKAGKMEIINWLFDLRIFSDVSNEIELLKRFWTCENPQTVSDKPEEDILYLETKDSKKKTIYIVECQTQCRKCIEKESFIKRLRLQESNED